MAFVQVLTNNFNVKWGYTASRDDNNIGSLADLYNSWFSCALDFDENFAPLEDFENLSPRVDLEIFAPLGDFENLSPRVDLEIFSPLRNFENLSPRVDLEIFAPSGDFENLSPRLDLEIFARYRIRASINEDLKHDRSCLEMSEADGVDGGAICKRGFIHLQFAEKPEAPKAERHLGSWILE
ncbi:hypothetical protein V1477_004248 [Vespula maculifrons]|uniref:Uncharacterized protein n=1 Tax=Vespula maculifrons TaxID=7453 RepID=A0ABD2CRF5_VESMC